ncbi:PH domain-containing protein [Chloroflexia bacterium SDU3-3]|nr:PH domain-containing protein [Chloroflexia bacterium SDU3-3]
MAYIDDLLGRDEKVIYIGRQHIFILIGNILAELSLIVLMVAAGVASQVAFPNSRQGMIGNMPIGQMVLIVCLVISLIILVSAIIDYLRWVSTEFVITNHRVVRLRGVVNKEAADSSLDKINDLELRQSWLGRMFDFGDVEILTASDTGANVLQKIAHPLDFKRAMNDAKQQYIHGFGYYDPREVEPYVSAGGALAGGGDLEHTLSTLAELRDRGVLSNEEFELKKRELLSRI